VRRCPTAGDKKGRHAGAFNISIHGAARIYLRTRTNQENFMTEKTASVHWEGRGKKGQGQISTDTDALKAYPYGFGSRFEDDRSGTNPEELLGAAHAACFTMAFSFACDKAGFGTSSVDTRAKVRLVPQGDGFLIDRIALTLEAVIPGIDEAKFQELAEGAKKACPLSKALASVPEITLSAALRQ
jgi:osmotically inducible protein OsmC